MDELLATVGGLAEDDQVSRAEITVGREAEIREIQRLLNGRRHVLLVGKRGLGKSHLLRYVAREMVEEPDRLLVLDDFKAVRRILQMVAVELHERGHLSQFKDLEESDLVRSRTSKWRINDLAQLVADSIYGQDYTLVIDNLETITPSGVAVFQQLSDVTVVVGAARTERLDRLDEIIGRLNRIELRPLADEAIREMLWSSVDYDGVRNPQMLATQVVKKARGVPGAVADAITRYAAGGSGISAKEIRDIQGTSQATDLTWVLVVAVVGVMVMRYVSRAMDSTTAYVVFGGLSAVGMLLRSVLYRMR